MKDLGAEIRYFIERNGLKQKEVAAKAGFSREHFWQLIQKNDLTCSQLERICMALKLDPAYFFDMDDLQDELSIPDSDKNGKESDVLHYISLLKEKEERIKVLEKNVSLLENLLSLYRDKNGTSESKKAS